MSFKYFERIAVAILMAGTAALFASCDDDDVQETTTEPPEPEKELTVALQGGQCEQNALTFTVEASENAAQIAYACVAKGRVVPGAEKLFEEGTVATPGSEVRRVEGLAPETDYVIAAAARADNRYSEVATLELRTADEPEPEYNIIEATSSRGSKYYGNIITGETGTGLYHLFLSTIPWDENGMAAGAGVVYRLSLHAAPSEDPEHATLAAGTYTLDDNFAAGTFDTEYSDWVATNDQGQAEASNYFLGGEITVTNENGVYEIVARMIDLDGKRDEVRWNGPIVWENKVPTGTAHYANAFYMGKNEKHPDSDYWIMQLADNGDDPAWVLTLELYSQVAADYKNPVIADGTYSIDPSFSCDPFTLVPGLKGPSPSLDQGTYFDTNYGTWYLTEGTLTVTGNGGEYTFDCSLRDAEGREAVVRYSGALTVDNRYTPPVDWDVDVTFDRLLAGKYYGETNTSGIYKYALYFSDKEVAEWWDPKPDETHDLNLLSLILYSATAPTTANIRIPEGTYVYSKNYEDFVCDPYSSKLQYWDADGTLFPAKFAAVSITFTYTDDVCRMELDGENKEGQSVHCLYEGALAIDNASGIPLPFELPPHPASERRSGLLRIDRPSVMPSARLCCWNDPA